LVGDQPLEAGVLLGQCFETPSLADLMLAPQLDFLQQTPEWEALTAGHASLRQWLARMQARPSMQATSWEKVAARVDAPAAPLARAAAG